MEISFSTATCYTSIIGGGSCTGQFKVVLVFLKKKSTKQKQGIMSAMPLVCPAPPSVDSVPDARMVRLGIRQLLRSLSSSLSCVHVNWMGPQGITEILWQVNTMVLHWSYWAPRTVLMSGCSEWCLLTIRGKTAKRVHWSHDWVQRVAFSQDRPLVAQNGLLWAVALQGSRKASRPFIVPAIH